MPYLSKTTSLLRVLQNPNAASDVLVFFTPLTVMLVVYMFCPSHSYGYWGCKCDGQDYRIILVISQSIKQCCDYNYQHVMQLCYLLLCSPSSMWDWNLFWSRSSCSPWISAVIMWAMLHDCHMWWSPLSLSKWQNFFERRLDYWQVIVCVCVCVCVCAPACAYDLSSSALILWIGCCWQYTSDTNQKQYR